MTADSFKVLLTAGCFEPGQNAGGPIKSVARIVDTTGPQVSVTVLTSDRDLGVEQPYPGLSGTWVRRGDAYVHYLDKTSVRQWRHLLRRLRRERIDLLYCNSLWEPLFSVVPMVLSRLGVIRPGRVLIAPRGELSPGALRLKSRKKSLFLKLWRPLLDSEHVLWHASTEMEAEDIRAFWPGASIEVVEDQVDLPKEPLHPSLGSVAYLRVVFIGRISPMKNLLAALQALKLCKQAIQFKIFGPVEDRDYWARCQSSIQEMPSHIQVRYLGPLDPSSVRSAFAQSEIFLFPTLGENFGHVVPESLSASCAVIASDRTPWTELLNSGGGAALSDISPRELARVVDEAAAMTVDEKLKMRLEAGAAYRRWRAGVSNENILDRIAAHHKTADRQSAFDRRPAAGSFDAVERGRDR